MHSIYNIYIWDDSSSKCFHFPPQTYDCQMVINVHYRHPILHYPWPSQVRITEGSAFHSLSFEGTAIFFLKVCTVQFAKDIFNKLLQNVLCVTASYDILWWFKRPLDQLMVGILIGWMAPILEDPLASQQNTSQSPIAWCFGCLFENPPKEGPGFWGLWYAIPDIVRKGLPGCFF